MTKDEALNLLSEHTYFSEDLGITFIDSNMVNSIIETIFDSQQKPKALTVQVPNEYTNINQDAFNEWMKYKKYKSKAAITKTLKLLNKYDFETQQIMVDISIGNEYKGLFPPKQKRNRTDNNVDVAKQWLHENDTQSQQQEDLIEYNKEVMVGINAK